MKFLKAKLIYILIAFMAVLCTASVAIAVSTSVTMIEKRDQIIKTTGDTAVNLQKNDAKSSILNLKKASEHSLYFNGEEQEGLKLYTSNKKDKNRLSLLPLDLILDDLGFRQSLYNSDDIFKAIVNGKPLILKLDSSEALYGSKKITADTASIAALNHILASPNVLDMMDGFDTETFGQDGSLFVNYWPGSKNKDLSKTVLLNTEIGSPVITDLSGKELLVYGKDGPGKVDDIVYNSYIQTYILKSNGRIYYINSHNYRNPRIFNVNSNYAISSDGRFLYWENKAKDALYIYNVKTGIRKKVKDYLPDAELSDTNGQAQYKLLDFEYGRRYKRLTFKGTNDALYTVIERNGTVVAEGKSLYSPDSKKVLYYDGISSWYIADTDGTDIIMAGIAQNAYWIDNDRVMLENGQSHIIFNTLYRLFANVPNEWRFVGRSPDGSVYFTNELMLYRIKNGTESRMQASMRSCDYLYANTKKDTYTLMSLQQNRLYCISGTDITELGKPGLFPNKQQGLAETAFMQNTSVNPDGSRLAVLQNGSRYVEVNIMDYADMSVKKLVLNESVKTGDISADLKIQWLDKNRLAVFSAKNVWVADMAKDTYIYKRTLDNNSAVVGIIKK